MHPAIFLDRDGVLIENRSDYVRDWSEAKIFPQAIDALTHPALQNYKVVIITNQSAVGRGLISLEAADKINRRLIDLIHLQSGRVDAVYMCPHSPEDGCLCRKPKPGLLVRAAEELSLDLRCSWMIGDAWSDVLAGQTAGVRQSVLLRTGRGREQLKQVPPEGVKSHLIFDDLSQALTAIFAVDSRHANDAFY
jgi:D-glycero-D-manno-heptose 1,7-bisphosphate phosphatase